MCRPDIRQPERLEESNHGWVNDPTSAVNLQLNELIEHIATFALNLQIRRVNAVVTEQRKCVVQIFVNLSDQLIILSVLNFIISIMTALQTWKRATMAGSTTRHRLSISS
jgi:hha toxicity modulator TomB